MKMTKLFTKTIRQAPSDEKSINAQLLIKAGFIDKLFAGVYTYLPLGLRTLNKIAEIIREEMDAIGGEEILMPALHPKDSWQKTDRWKINEMFKIKNQLGKDYGLGWTHEEIITPLIKKYVNSYKDLPLAVYQIQDKFRDELRAKSGILRGREFLMKDLYSFHLDEKDLDSYYEKVQNSYYKIFKRTGIEDKTYLTLASGSAFSKYSMEFQTVTKNGEDTIYICEKCRVAINKEVISDQKGACFKCKNKNLKVAKSIEVGNIFKLSDRFSKAFDFLVKDKNNKEKNVLMASYGIGLGRLMGTIVEIFHDDKGIIWPVSVAPFKAHFINLNAKKAEADKIYNDLIKNKIEILYDDSDRSVGEKLNDADLIGIPLRIIVSEKTLKQNAVEIKKRSEEKTQLVKISDLNKIEKC